LTVLTDAPVSTGLPVALMSDLLVREPGAIRIGPFGSALKKDEYSESGIRVLGIDDVLTRGNPRKPKFIPEAKYRELTQYRVRAGDILVTNMGTVGRAFLVPPGFETAIISSHLIKVTPDLASVDAHYLEWALNAAPAVVAQIVRDSRGAIMAGFNTSRLKALAIPLPSLAEQRRIAGILDRADALRSKRRTGLARIDLVGRSIFLDMFGDPWRNSRAWPTAPLGAIARILRGASPRPKGDPRYFGGVVPWLMISDVTSEAGKYVSRTKEGVTEAGRDKSIYLPAGTLVLTNSATVGVPKILGIAACIHDGFLAFTDLDSRIEQDFLYFFLLLMRSRLSALAPEGTQKNLNTGIAKAIRIVLPPRELQRYFGARLAALDQFRVQSNASLSQLDLLFASLQYHAFRGEL
jgi:type I restriction enzyme, S subunit